MPVSFFQRECDQNPWCPVTKMCPTGAMSMDKKTSRPTFDDSKSSGCATCVSSCPRGAMVVR